ncbi:hypothetical protein RF55_18906 [Lasius niger]|uniref:Uncharacterized protein n=1 Tax=Lasius niger TaxID=67767 RepID=A0A0J7K094_LASNI|nr:hypothetical protein RF55_18906 [Lasius niger]
MLGLDMKPILISGILLLLLTSIGMLSYVMWAMSRSKKYKIDTDPATKVMTVKDDGVGDDAPTFWTEKKFWMYTPNVLQILSVVLAGILIYVK